MAPPTRSSRGQLLTLTLVLALCVDMTLTNAGMSHSRVQNRNLQRVIRHDTIVLVLEGVRERHSCVQNRGRCQALPGGGGDVGGLPPGGVVSSEGDVAQVYHEQA